MKMKKMFKMVMFILFMIVDWILFMELIRFVTPKNFAIFTLSMLMGVAMIEFYKARIQRDIIEPEIVIRDTPFLMAIIQLSLLILCSVIMARWIPIFIGISCGCMMTILMHKEFRPELQLMAYMVDMLNTMIWKDKKGDDT